jgi:hypothetical protein
MSKVDENFPEVTAIVRDTIEGKPMLLAFGDYFYDLNPAILDREQMPDN